MNIKSTFAASFRFNGLFFGSLLLVFALFQAGLVYVVYDLIAKRPEATLQVMHVSCSVFWGFPVLFGMVGLGIIFWTRQLGGVIRDLNIS